MRTLALLRDFEEEQWPSMRVVADGLEGGLRSLPNRSLEPVPECAKYQSIVAKVAVSSGAARNVDRLANRFLVYPRYARSIAGKYDLFHVCDHSYSQLIHKLPADRTGVYCHDLDTFRCLLDPIAEPRPRWFRAMARRILTGMQKARLVFHSTDGVRAQMLRHGLIDPDRLIKAPLGVAPVFSAAPTRDEDVATLRSANIPLDRPFLLHVGSCIPRKRIDVLLDVFAKARQNDPALRLVKISGAWTAPQWDQIERLQIGGDILRLGQTDPDVIAACYRRADVVLVTSDAEGFGLPVAEALACGGTVLCSDIPPLREVGSDAALYVPVADVDAFAATIDRVRRDPSAAPSRDARLRRAADFTWERHAAIIADAYDRLPRMGSRLL